MGTMQRIGSMEGTDKVKDKILPWLHLTFLKPSGDFPDHF